MSNIESEELKSLVRRIIDSGELGRSKTYAAILDYLLECSLTGASPKEMAIAIDVLGRDADFDVAKDSIVRVHIYHLRNKLKAYFVKHGKTEKYCLEIPKGQYIITTHLNETGEESNSANLSVSGKRLNRSPMTMWLGSFLVLLLLLNLILQSKELSQDEGVVQSRFGPWLAMMDDQEPILIVVGDYYIFGELDEGGNVQRMVREFDINSQEDLVLKQSMGGEQASRYFDLELSYIPTSIAFALSQVMPMLNGAGSKVSVKMMTELTTADLVSNHIVYLGYLSGLGSLSDLVFSASGLAIGSTFDELYEIETGELYSSSSGLSIGENSFKDYGMLSVFPGPNEHQFIMIAGMRDEGLINVSQEISNLEAWGVLKDSLGADLDAYEALYEVSGFDSTNFKASLEYSKSLDTELIWEARLTND